jgi:hypothetical protein
MLAWQRHGAENSLSMRNNLRLLKKLWLTLKPNKVKLPQKMGSFVIWQPDQIDVSTTFFEQSKGEMFTMGEKLDEFSKYIIDLASDVPPELLDTPEFSQYTPYINWAERYAKDLGPEINDLQVKHAKNVEARL